MKTDENKKGKFNDWSDLSTLNEEQRNAVLESVNHNVVLLAGAGSGKTHTLVKRTGYLIADKGVSPESIMVITFTQKAAEEIRNRMSDIVPDNKDMWIGTIHSICVKIFAKYMNYVGYEKFKIVEERRTNYLLKKCSIDVFEATGLVPDTENNIKKKIVEYRNTLVSVNDLKKELVEGNYSEEVKKKKIALIMIYEAYEKELVKQQEIDFDGLIIKTIEILSSVKEAADFVHDRFKYIMLDECQDTNVAQFTLLTLLKGNNNVMLVGDVNQSIYGFRNASPEMTEEFASKTANTYKMKLEQNYRSTANIINGANEVISNNEFGTKLKMYTDNEEGEKIHIIEMDETKRDLDWKIQEILMLRDRGIEFTDIAVIYRTNREIWDFNNLLNQYCIPHNMMSLSDFYSNEEVKVLLAMCLFYYDSKDVLAFRTILSIYAGLSKGDIDDIIINSYKKKIPLLVSMSEFFGRFERKELRNLYKIFSKRFTRCSDLVFYIIAVTGKRMIRSKKLYGKEIQKNDSIISEFQNVIFNMEHDMTRGDTYLSLLRELNELTESDGTLDNRMDYQSIKLLTAHSAKGLEFDVVFIADATEKFYPIRRVKAKMGRDIIYEYGNWEEERRLFYVAMTRARKRLYIISDRTRRSMYLDEIPEEYSDCRVV